MWLILELIDTLWNVNYYKYTQETYGTMELIDTLWNVNLISERERLCKELRINRYIMECKSRVQEHIKRR